MCYNGTCNTAVFNTWIEKILIPELRPGQVIIMDNASFHKSQKTKDLIEAVGCIEIFWANFKKLLKKNLIKFKPL